MKISDFKKLKSSIEEQDFNKSFANINKVMFVLSIFGHFASIFLAFFLVYKILAGAITDNPILVTVSSIILLGGLELLKREIFDKFSLQQIKLKNIIHSDVLPLMFSSLLIVSLSFYATITGAHEFASKSDEIDTQLMDDLNKYSDSLKSTYKLEIENINSEITQKKQKIDLKDAEQTQIENNPPLNPSARARVKDLKTEKSDLKKEIQDLEKKTKSMNEDMESKIAAYKSEMDGKGIELKNSNQTNSVMFVFISILIEFLILGGVYFNEYYKWRSYEDFKKKIEKDPNFQKWYNYNNILEIIYTQDSKINDRLPSGKTIQDVLKVNGVILLNKDITEMFKLFGSLGITKTVGSAKYFAKSKEVAHEILKSHFKIQ